MENRTAIVTTSIDLMNLITHEYGAAQGIELWTAISKALGEEVEQEIFMDLLKNAGSADGFVSVEPALDVKARGDYVSMIKTVRNFTGMGLQEAKEWCDIVESGTTSSLRVADRRKFIHDLSAIGVKAS